MPAPAPAAPNPAPATVAAAAAAAVGEAGLAKEEDDGEVEEVAGGKETPRALSVAVSAVGLSLSWWLESEVVDDDKGEVGEDSCAAFHCALKRAA